MSAPLTVLRPLSSEIGDTSTQAHGAPTGHLIIQIATNKQGMYSMGQWDKGQFTSQMDVKKLGDDFIILSKSLQLKDDKYYVSGFSI